MEGKTGKLWFGSKSENMFVYDGKTFTVLKNKDGKAFENVWSIIEDKKGNIWTTGADEPPRIGQVWSLSRYDAKSLYNKIPTVTEIKSGRIMEFLAILEANDGSIWYGSAPGVYRYDGKTITDFKSKEDQK
jgi:ligand-binding sensor domain-containing protein